MTKIEPSPRAMDTAFNQIRQYGSQAYEVMCHALGAIETIGHCANRRADLEIIKLHADPILQDALNDLTSEWSKDKVRAAYKPAIRVIDIQ